MLESGEVWSRFGWVLETELAFWSLERIRTKECVKEGGDVVATRPSAVKRESEEERHVRDEERDYTSGGSYYGPTYAQIDMVGCQAVCGARQPSLVGRCEEVKRHYTQTHRKRQDHRERSQSPFGPGRKVCAGGETGPIGNGRVTGTTYDLRLLFHSTPGLRNTGDSLERAMIDAACLASPASESQTSETLGRVGSRLSNLVYSRGVTVQPPLATYEEVWTTQRRRGHRIG
ncbi:hypothetical protein FA13DRAFT_1828314 [Coprinellus micaceus]|uniref:Uncharacterized protein n=1 Tax=Coprinellus micaceus TaxID=71717 RepID=A0A4Y7TIS3_COPMI|nr:hypothetical protein FA13DRAFT_1828314 [Coprinellus micaceus]